MTPGSLQLGLEGVQGTIRFRDLKLEVLELTEVYPAVAPAGTRAIYTDRVLNAPRRRGAMSPSRFCDTVISKDLPDLRSWGANLIRWQLRNWNMIMYAAKHRTKRSFPTIWPNRKRTDRTRKKSNIPWHR